MKNLDPEARFVLPARPAPSMPPGLVELMEDLSRNVLRHDPEDIFAFCAEHMRKLLVLRDGEESHPKTEKKPLKVKIANAIAEYHKKAEKRRASYDRLLAEAELGNEQSEQVNGDENEDNGNKSKDHIEKSGSLSLLKTKQISQTDLDDERVLHDKSYDEAKPDFKVAETVTSSVDEHSLNKVASAINEIKSAQVATENPVDVEFTEDTEIKQYKSDKEGPIIMDPNTVFIQKGQEIGEQNDRIFTKSKEHEDFEEVKRTVCDALAEIETAAIKTVSNLTNLGLQNNLQGHMENLNSLSDEGYLNSTSNIENINNEKGTLRESSTSEANILNKSEAEVNVSTIFEANSQDTMNSLSETEKNLLDSSNKSLNKTQEKMDANFDQKMASIERSLITQEEMHLQKHVSDLENDIVEFTSNVLQLNDFQNVVEAAGTAGNDEPLSIQVDYHEENNIHQDSNLNTEQKDLIDNSTFADSTLKQENVITDNQPVKTKDTDNIIHKENNDIAVYTVGKPQNIHDGVNASTASLEIDTEPSENLSAAKLVTEKLEQNIVISEDPLNEIKLTLTENQLNSSFNTNDGEEEGDNNDVVKDLSNSERSLKSNDSGDTDDATNSNSAEANKSVDNSDNSANLTMDLETAAVTIQKVFRSFLFKSRASTIDDETPLDIPYLADAIQDSSDGIESIAKIEEEEPRNPNKERRNLGLSRMDTVLQTVNEEKSLSLSDDSSTLSSAATVIQAHVRGYLVRNKLNKTRSVSLTKSHTQSSELENDQQKNKTVLNIHIVPEGSHFMSQDESLTLSLDLPLDTSPRPSLTSYHSLGYDITERRKLLKREDAIQSSISPPSTKGGKSVDVPITSSDIGQPGIGDERSTLEDKSENEDVKESEISGDTTPTVSTTAETVIELIKEMELNSESIEPQMKLNSDEIEGSEVSTSQEKDVLSEPMSEKYSGVMHSGEFHDVVLPPQPTQLSRDDPKHVARGE